MKKAIKAATITGIVIFSLLNVCLIVLALCVNDVRKADSNSENAIDAILNELQHSKIIAIGESHERVNEQLFIAGNIQALYNAGVRYIFAEGGATPEESLPSSEGYSFIMFYPWEKRLGYFQELFVDEQAYSMESLPLAYQKAALCAEKSGNRQLAEEYQRIAGALYNEYNITVDKNKTSYVGYFN